MVRTYICPLSDELDRMSAWIFIRDQTFVDAVEEMDVERLLLQRMFFCE